jgi:hypothetical protein
LVTAADAAIEHQAFRKSSGAFAIFAAICLASSLFVGGSETPIRFGG